MEEEILGTKSKDYFPLTPDSIQRCIDYRDELDKIMISLIYTKQKLRARFLKESKEITKFINEQKKFL